MGLKRVFGLGIFSYLFLFSLTIAAPDSPDPTPLPAPKPVEELFRVDGSALLENPDHREETIKLIQEGISGERMPFSADSELRGALVAGIDSPLNLLKTLAKNLNHNQLPKNEALSLMFYQLTISALADDLVSSVGKGRLFLRSYLQQLAESGIKLSKLQRLIHLRNEGKPIQIAMAFDQEHIDKANLRLSRLQDFDSGIKFSDIVVFVKDTKRETFDYRKPWSGETGKKYEKVTTFRNRVIPLLAFSAALLGGTLDYFGLDPAKPDSQREAIVKMLPLLPWVAGGVAAGVVSRKVVKNDLSTATIVTLVTLFGAANHFGTNILGALAVPIVVGATAATLEWQFSKFSAQWSTWVWELGYADKLLKKVRPGFFNEKILRPSLGFATNFGVNTGYPIALDFMKWLSSSFLLLATADAASGFKISGGGIVNALQSDAENAAKFTASFGIFQIMIGNLRKQGEIGELQRFTAETGAVFLNGAIGRVLAVAMASSVMGDTIMTSFAIGVSVPTLAYFILLPQFEKLSDAYASRVATKGIPGILKPVEVGRDAVRDGVALGARGLKRCAQIASSLISSSLIFRRKK
ncbi:MAG: hypothetical protein J0L93_05330 [Deltaproteobacteria bacterium]|nr:hypothetical protein [Deltaproteobacteria bacterium]